MTKINKSELMKRAWAIKKNLLITISEAMIKAWAEMKNRIGSFGDLISNRLKAEIKGDFIEIEITNYEFRWTLKKVKAMPGRVFDSAKKLWLVPIEYKSTVEYFISNY